MKKFLAILAVAATMFAVDAKAQSSKELNAAKAALDKAQAAAENPKQNTKMATWMKYGETLVKAYDASLGNAWVGMSAQEFQVLAAGDRPVSESQVVVGGEPLTKREYLTRADAIIAGAHGLVAGIAENGLQFSRKLDFHRVKLWTKIAN